jgi:glutamate racemase
MSHRLGIVDWGIGGIGLYKLIKDQIRVPITYFSDTGVTPYGKMSPQELAARLVTVLRWLKHHDVTHILIGCNAASTAIPRLKEMELPILGVIESAIQEALRRKPRSLGLIGGRRTVISGSYRRPFNDNGIPIKQRIAQPLSARVEAGDLSSSDLSLECRRILKPLRDCSHILLACTHYPAIENILRQHVSDKTEFIDPAGAVVERVRQWELDGTGMDEFFTTGRSSEMQRSARAAFGVHLDQPRHIRVR